jgi:hypothetical protein
MAQAGSYAAQLADAEKALAEQIALHLSQRNATVEKVLRDQIAVLKKKAVIERGRSAICSDGVQVKVGDAVYKAPSSGWDQRVLRTQQLQAKRYAKSDEVPRPKAPTVPRYVVTHISPTGDVAIGTTWGGRPEYKSAKGFYGSEKNALAYFYKTLMRNHRLEEARLAQQIADHQMDREDIESFFTPWAKENGFFFTADESPEAPAQ